MKTPSPFLSRLSAAQAASGSALTGWGCKISSTTSIAVTHGVSRPRLERVREGVAEVEDAAPVLFVRIGDDDRALVRRAGADHLALRQAPHLAPGEQAGLHHLGHAGQSFLFGEGRQKTRVYVNPPRRMERAYEVLPRVGVDPRLTADSRVDHANKRRRHGDPTNAAEIRRGHKSREVRRGASTERDNPAVAPDLELLRQTLNDSERLRPFTAWHRMRGHRRPKKRQLMETRDAFVDHDRCVVRQSLARKDDVKSREEKGLGILTGALRQDVVNFGTLVVETLEVIRILGKGTVGAPDTRPSGLEVDGDPDEKSASVESGLCGCRQHSPSSQGDDGGRSRQRLGDDLLLHPPELRLTALLEDRGDRAVPLLDLFVRVDEGPFCQAGDLTA